MHACWVPKPPPHLAVVFGKRRVLNIILHTVHCPCDSLERWGKALSSEHTKALDHQKLAVANYGGTWEIIVS